MRGLVSLALLALPLLWLARCTLSTPTGGLSSGGVGGDSDGGSTAKDGGAVDAAAGDISVTAVLGCDGGSSCTVRSCKVLGGLVPRLPNGVYWIDPDDAGPATAFRAYCDVDNGGWTLLLKVDGRKDTFNHGSTLWEDEVLWQIDHPDLDLTEAKLAGYTTMPLTEIRVGMQRTPEQSVPHFIVVPAAAGSLRELFAGPERLTSVGRDKWLTLVDDPTVQSNCNAEGFNLVRGKNGGFARIRMGMIFNNESDCVSPDSYIAVAGWSGTGNYASTSAGPPRDADDFAYLMIR